MATRQKTVEYCFPLATAIVASAVPRDLTQITIDLPETGKVFRSVILQVAAMDANVAAASATANLLGIQLNAIARDDVTVTSTLTNSGENQAWVFERNVTSYFVTNWAGTSMTCDVRHTLTGISCNNVSAKLLITYDYDDTSATHIKTVRIPIEGNNANLTAAYTNVGGVANNIPALDTFLPEASKVYRSIFLETYCNEAVTAAQAPNPSLDLRWDGATTVSDGLHEDALVSARSFIRRDILLGTLNTAATATLEAKTSGTTAMPFSGLTPVLIVTYEFDPAATTTVMNSVILPMFDDAGWLGGPLTTDKTRFTRELFVEEPGTITLVQSGWIMSLNDSAAVQLDLRAGAQPARLYNHNTNTVRCGCMFVGRRLDSGAVGGAGMTLARGSNTITLDAFRTGTATGTLASNISAALYLNYTSAKATDGVGAHAHTVIHTSKEYAIQAVLTEIAAAGIPIPEANYWLMAVGFILWNMPVGTVIADTWIALHVEVLSAEAEGAGWRNIYVGTVNTDAELGFTNSWARARSEFRRFPEDADSSRLDIKASRRVRFANAPIGFFFGNWLVSYHSISVAKAGTISNFAGDGSGIPVNIYRADTNERIRTVTSVAGGGFSFTWYDDVVELYAEARENASKVGRSDDTLGALDIAFASAGGGGETFTGSLLNRGLN
jgi:hypothetical protein